MPTTLASLRTRVQQTLADTGAAIWTTADLDEAISKALAEYSETRPYEADTTLLLAAAGREISISTVTGLLEVGEVWCPYTASDPEDPPNKRTVRHWPDQAKIYVSGGAEPAAGDVLRLFYSKGQTLNGLAGETTTTFSPAHDSLLVEGSAGYAATSRAVDLAEKMTIDRATAQQVRAWGMVKLQEFRAGLRRIGKKQAGRGSSRVKVGKLDKRDRDWS